MFYFKYIILKRFFKPVIGPLGMPVLTNSATLGSKPILQEW